MRYEIDHSMPMEVNFKKFYKAKTADISRLVATLQILNHTRLRYKTPLAHSIEDDSFLSLYTDPELVPEAGQVKAPRGHGYSVHYRPSSHELKIRGPDIEKDLEYVIEAELSSSRLSSSRSMYRRKTTIILDGPGGKCTQTASCRDVGRLEVFVPSDRVSNNN